MSRRSLHAALLAGLCLAHGAAFAFAEIDELEARLAKEKTAIEAERDAHNAACKSVPASQTAKAAACEKRKAEVSARIEKYKREHWDLTLIMEAVAGERDFFYAIDKPELRIPLGIKLLANKLGWSAEKQARLAKALKDLGFDGMKEITEDNVRAGWRAVWDSADNAELARAADKAGPHRAAVGQQLTGDCAVAAVATATGKPYDEVAAQAKDLIRQGPWRHDAEREDPDGVLKKGLTGGEVVMLAESLGRTEVVPQSRFEQTLKSGRPVLVNVATISTTHRYGVTTTAFADHELVLTQTFKHGGKTWYEIANPSYPGSRYFATPDQLNLILQEKGVAVGKP